MKNEEKIKQSLEKKFNDKIEVEVRSKQKMWAKVSADILHDVVKYMFDELKFQYLATITGTEEGDNFEILYHLQADEHSVLCTVRAVMPISKPDLETITDIIPGAIWYERELVDMFGVNVKGLPKGNRYPLPDGWPKDIHPLRKNLTQEELGQYPKEGK